MTMVSRVKPDLEFIKELQQVGGENVKKCFQCATCSVVCPLSPMDKSFPRKEMVWAQWGLKDKLVNDIDMWLCHKCGQCSEMCPRGAKPGELMAALRNMAYRNLTGPSFLGKWMSSVKHLPKLIAIPAIIYLIIWFITGSMNGSAFPLLDGHVDYSLLFPGDYTIDPIFGLASVFVIWSFYKGIMKLKEVFDAQPKTFVIGYEKPKTIWHALYDVIKDEVLTHKKFKDCGEEETDEVKFKGHLMLFYGFVALFIVTGVVAFTHWGGKVLPFLHMKYPMPIYNPIKLLANVGAVLLIVGLVYLTKRRLNETKKDASTYYDWYLLGLIWVIGLSGILSEVLRWANIAGLAYPIYFIHLVSVFMLIAYLPWSKLGHLVYRVFALAYARMIGRVSTEVDEQKNKLFVI
ncbi:quinone-interacting membrane-bound oxidoreductase complex subunit QmoC [Desulfothermus okinawensis JCM 13304]